MITSVHISTLHQTFDVRIFHKECKTLAQAGYNVILLNAAECTAQKKLDSVTVYQLAKQTSQSKLLIKLHYFYGILQKALSLDAQLYHLHEPELLLMALLLKLLRPKSKIIYDVHEDTPKEAISLNKESPIKGRLKCLMWTALERSSVLYIDAFICATKTISQNFPSHKSAVVHNFPRLEENYSLAYSLPKPRERSYYQRASQFVYAGGLTHIRGIAEMVEAIGKLPPYLDATLVLMGNFFPKAWQSELEQMTGWQAVNYMGWQSRQSVMSELKSARAGLVVLHPEQIYIDSIPNKLFEYMAAGLPVIASNFPWWQKLIVELDCGLVVNPLDSQDIADAMQYLLEHPDIAEKMGHNGRQAVKNRFNWEADSKQLLDLYHLLLSGEKSSKVSEIP